MLFVVLALTLSAQLNDTAPPPVDDAASDNAAPVSATGEDGSVVPAQASLARDCAAIFGDDQTLEDRRASRAARLEEVSRSERLLDVVHSDPAWQAPKPMRVPGLDVVGLETGADGQPAARVRLADSWSGSCAPGDYLILPDDGLGSDGLVLAVLDEGVLAEHRGELIFLPKSGTHAPTFRMIWRSGFALNIDPGSNPAIGGSPTGSSPKRNSTTRAPASKRDDAKQRAKANAKAAAENRRNMSTRPIRPRG